MNCFNPWALRETKIHGIVPGFSVYVLFSPIRNDPNLHRANGRGGFGSQTAADPPWRPPTTPEKQPPGTVTASHKILPLQALSSSLNAGTEKRGCLGLEKAVR